MIHWIQQWHSFRKDSNDTPTEAIFLAYTKKCEQECIPVGCVPSAGVAVSPAGGRSLPQCMLGYPQEQTPRTRHPPSSLHGTRHPPGADPLPRTRHPPPRADPPWDQALSPPGSRHPPGPGTPPRSRHPSCGQTHTCKNITFATSLRTVRTRNRNGC